MTGQPDTTVCERGGLLLAESKPDHGARSVAGLEWALDGCIIVIIESPRVRIVEIDDRGHRRG